MDAHQTSIDDWSSLSDYVPRSQLIMVPSNKDGRSTTSLCNGSNEDY